jgi:hypothetical protein
MRQENSLTNMENAAKPAVEELVVRVWGMNAKGKAFSQNAYAGSLAIDGALLSGVDHPLTLGDTIGVQHQDKKARFKVVTARDAGLPHKIQVEVQLVTGQKCPWAAQIPIKPVTRGILTPRINSKRRFERLRVPFPIEIRDDRGGPAMQTAASDISGRGCYVESQAPLPLGMPLTIIFWIETDKIITPAVVRTSDPGVGMGIEFIGLSPQNQGRVQQAVERAFAGSRGF